MGLNGVGEGGRNLRPRRRHQPAKPCRVGEPSSRAAQGGRFPLAGCPKDLKSLLKIGWQRAVELHWLPRRRMLESQALSV